MALSLCSSLGKTEAPDLCDRPGDRSSVSELCSGRPHLLDEADQGDVPPSPCDCGQLSLEQKAQVASPHPLGTEVPRS